MAKLGVATFDCGRLSPLGEQGVVSVPEGIGFMGHNAGLLR